MTTIIIGRDIAEALQSQFQDNVKENYENDCEIISIGGTVNISDIDYLEMENFLVSNWSYTDAEASDRITETQELFSSDNGLISVLWEN